MKEDDQNYSPTVMFRGTPCIFRLFPYVNFKCLKLSNKNTVFRHFGGFTVLGKGIEFLSQTQIFQFL